MRKIRTEVRKKIDVRGKAPLRGEDVVMQRLVLAVGMLVEMKKIHPCGSAEFKVTRTGADIRAVCCGCGREMLVPRVKFEKSVKKIKGFASAV